MKTMKITIVSFIMLLMVNVQGQNSLPDLAINSNTYHTAVGLRGGETSGLTIKQFVGGTNAIEGIIGLWHHGVSATVLFEKHQSAFNVSGLNWYYGAGGHASIASRYAYYDPYRDRYRKYYEGSVGLGVDGIVGIEYKIPKAPIALSFDVKPFVEVVSRGYIYSSLDPGLGIKITF